MTTENRFVCPVCQEKVEVFYTGGKVIMDLNDVVVWNEDAPMIVRGRSVWLQCSANEDHDVSVLDEYLTEPLVDRITKESQKTLDEFEEFLNSEEE